MSIPVFKLSDTPSGSGIRQPLKMPGLETPKMIAGVAALSVGSFDLCSTTLNSIFHSENKQTAANPGYFELGQFVSGQHDDENNNTDQNEVLKRHNQNNSTRPLAATALAFRNSDLVSNRRGVTHNDSSNNQMWPAHHLSEANLNKNSSAAGSNLATADSSSSKVVYKKKEIAKRDSSLVI